jgi:hypothetical protein
MLVRRSGKIERTSGAAHTPGYYTSHFFIGGQLCHETNKGRQSEVQFFCCPLSGAPGEPPWLLFFNAFLFTPQLLNFYHSIVPLHNYCAVPTIESIEEPHQCKYRIKLCVPSLCHTVSPSPSPSATVEITPTSTPPIVAIEADTPEAGLGTNGRPPSFFAFIWRAIVGEQSEVMQKLTNGKTATGISPVRFGS